MAGRYRKVDTRIWNDARFLALGDDSKLVFLFALTHPHLTSLGAMRATVGGLAEELGWPATRFAEGLAPLVQGGMVRHDPQARLLWLPRFMRYNAPETPNVVRGWAKALDLLPECDLRQQAVVAAQVMAEACGEAFREAFTEAFGLPSRKGGGSLPERGQAETEPPSRKGGPSLPERGAAETSAPSRKGGPSLSEREGAKTAGPLPIQEQEQEQITGTGLPDCGPTAALRLVGPATAGPESVAVLELVELWNRIRSSCNTVRPATLSVKSKAILRAALQTRSLDEWESLFRRVEASDYLAGRTGGLPPLSLWKAIDLADRIEGGQYDAKPPQEAATAVDEWVPAKYRKGGQ